MNKLNEYIDEWVEKFKASKLPMRTFYKKNGLQKYFAWQTFYYHIRPDQYEKHKEVCRRYERTRLDWKSREKKKENRKPKAEQKTKKTHKSKILGQYVVTTNNGTQHLYKGYTKEEVAKKFNEDTNNVHKNYSIRML